MKAHRLTDLNTGHDACEPVPLATGSANVYVNGLRAGRVGDTYNPHECIDHPLHVGAVASGSRTVFINKKAAARTGDAVTCGGAAAQGSDNVFIGD